MTITVVASALIKSAFNFTESESNSIRSDNNSVQSNCAYTFGSGDLQINCAVKKTGVLPSSGSVMLDLTALTYTAFNISKTISMSGIKNICFTNNATVSGYDIVLEMLNAV